MKNRSGRSERPPLPLPRFLGRNRKTRNRVIYTLEVVAEDLSPGTCRASAARAG